MSPIMAKDDAQVFIHVNPKKKAVRKNLSPRCCAECNTQQTPTWRLGINGDTLCNKCVWGHASDPYSPLFYSPSLVFDRCHLRHKRESRRQSSDQSPHEQSFRWSVITSPATLGPGYSVGTISFAGPQGSTANLDASMSTVNETPSVNLESLHVLEPNSPDIPERHSQDVQVHHSSYGPVHDRPNVASPCLLGVPAQGWPDVPDCDSPDVPALNSPDVPPPDSTESSQCPSLCSDLPTHDDTDRLPMNSNDSDICAYEIDGCLSFGDHVPHPTHREVCRAIHLIYQI